MTTKTSQNSRNTVLKEVQSILADIMSDNGIFYLWQVFDNKTYSLRTYAEWKKEYREDEEISEVIEKIGDVLETRVVIWAMEKRINVTMAMFHLKNNFKWADKIEANARDRKLPTTNLWDLDL